MCFVQQINKEYIKVHRPVYSQDFVVEGSSICARGDDKHVRNVLCDHADFI